METLVISAMRDQLADRREKLEQALTHAPANDNLRYLLHEVDNALSKMNTGEFGHCETCHDPIEPERLAADPLIRNCIDHLTQAEQRALERDLDLAFQIQKGLLPKNDIAHAGWSATFHYEPAGSVSGDYCDIIIPDGVDDSMFFFVGDVTGKGVAASILMGHLHAMFRSLLVTNYALDELVARANRIFCDGTSSSHFATLVAGKAGSNGDVQLVNAGHCLPVLIGRSGIRTIGSTSLPIGLFCSTEFQPLTLHLSPGESLVVYTDGLTEARNESDALYSEERFTNLLGSHANSTTREILGSSLHDVRTFRGKAAKTDDLTILVLQRT